MSIEMSIFNTFVKTLCPAKSFVNENGLFWLLQTGRRKKLGGDSLHRLPLNIHFRIQFAR